MNYLMFHKKQLLDHNRKLVLELILYTELNHKKDFSSNSLTSYHMRQLHKIENSNTNPHNKVLNTKLPHMALQVSFKNMVQENQDQKLLSPHMTLVFLTKNNMDQRALFKKSLEVDLVLKLELNQLIGKNHFMSYNISNHNQVFILAHKVLC